MKRSCDKALWWLAGGRRSRAPGVTDREAARVSFPIDVKKFESSNRSTGNEVSSKVQEFIEHAMRDVKRDEVVRVVAAPVQP